MRTIFSKKGKHLLILFSLFLCLSQNASAKILDLRPEGPLEVRTQHPIYLQFLAMPMEAPQTLNRDQYEMHIETVVSNIFEFDNTGTTFVNLDMELWRTALVFKYGLTDQLDVKIEVPFISTSGGFLDAAVEWYHDLFNFPASGRKMFPYNQTAFQISQNGQRLANYPAVGFGISDINVRGKYLLSDKIKLPFTLAVAAYLKFPTGLTSKGTGSGHFDGGISFFGQKDLKRWHFTTQAGLALLGPHSHLNTITRHWYFSFGQSVRWQITNGFALVAQLTGNTSAFKNVSSEDLKQIVLDLNVGFAGTIPIKNSIFDEFFYQASLSEDIMSSGPSVDFSVLFKTGLRY